MKVFDLRFESASPPDVVTRDIVADWTDPLSTYGYRLTSQSDLAIVYHRKYRPWWVILLAICLFPLGLLFLLITYDATITATISRAEGGMTLVDVYGRAPKRIRRSLALRDSPV